MNTLLKDMLIPQIPVLEKIIRPILVYIFLLIGLRMAGKRELAQLNSFDFVVLLTLSNTVQNAIIGNDTSLSGGVIGAATLLFTNYIVVRFIFKHHHLEAIVQGEPVVLIEKGRIVQENAKRETICEDELLAIIRHQGIEKIEEVERATLESSGAISVIPRHPTSEESGVADMIRRLDRIEQLLQGRHSEDAPPSNAHEGQESQPAQLQAGTTRRDSQ